MYRINGWRSTVTRAATLVAGLALLAAPACGQQPQRVRPAVLSLAGAASAADSVLRVLAGQRASTEYEDAPGLSDEQRLMVGTCPGSCQYGPRARIQPHRGSYDSAAVPQGSVRFIARIINDDTVAYGKFNLHARDTVYWAIGTRGNRRVSIFYSSAPDARPYYSDLEVESHYVAMYRQATARWIWNDRDEAAWGTCDGGRCCRSSGIRLQE